MEYSRSSLTVETPPAGIATLKVCWDAFDGAGSAILRMGDSDLLRQLLAQLAECAQSATCECRLACAKKAIGMIEDLPAHCLS